MAGHGEGTPAPSTASSGSGTLAASRHTAPSPCRRRRRLAGAEVHGATTGTGSARRNSRSPAGDLRTATGRRSAVSDRRVNAARARSETSSLTVASGSAPRRRVRSIDARSGSAVGKHLVDGEPLQPPTAPRGEQPGHARRQEGGASEASGDRPLRSGRGPLEPRHQPRRGQDRPRQSGPSGGWMAEPLRRRWPAPNASTERGDERRVWHGRWSSGRRRRRRRLRRAQRLLGRAVGRQRYSASRWRPAVIGGRDRLLIRRRGTVEGARRSGRRSRRRGLGRHLQLPPGEDQVGVVEQSARQVAAPVGIPEDRPLGGVSIAALSQCRERVTPSDRDQAVTIGSGRHRDERATSSPPRAAPVASRPAARPSDP